MTIRNDPLTRARIKYLHEKRRVHEFRPWTGSPPPGREDDCGDCGKHKTAHPYTVIPVGTVDDQIVLGALIDDLAR